ncbi:bifunctional oligoribonuclease/PAP phosphatase NrnA [Patescibacteria group bacterium]
MNYKESEQILKEITKANKILINCHRNPDPDSIGCALALRMVVLGMNKQVEVICPSNKLFDNVNYLSGYNEINKGVDFSKFNFSDFDLLIILDSSSWGLVSDNKSFPAPDIKTVVVDHHVTNNLQGEVVLLDTSKSSVGEILFSIFDDWKVKLEKDTVDCIMAAIIGDTGAFRFPGVSSQTFEIVSKLMDLGADKDRAIHRIYRSESFNLIKFYGEVLSRAEIDKQGKFFFSAVPYEIYSKLDKPDTAKESAASKFAQIVEDTDFGFVAVETEPKNLAISFRSRSGFDTSKIAVQLGGGGHVYASAARIEGLDFDQAVERVLEVARKYAKKNNL